jgi:hypothetical protein
MVGHKSDVDDGELDLGSENVHNVTLSDRVYALASKAKANKTASLLLP